MHFFSIQSGLIQQTTKIIQPEKTTINTFFLASNLSQDLIDVDCDEIMKEHGGEKRETQLLEGELN
jgi:hypothetical protein